uniref:H15 domain-containing protein n=1 Tax=Amazona collaria TaxID=241587 RepID=A0A8B9G5N7_9PSIT
MGASLPAAGAAGTAQLPGLLAQCRGAPHPSTMQMVIEALQAKDSRKGASAAAIKKFILAKYPTVDPTRLKYWLKVTLSKGLSRGDLVRPHNSTATGAAGSFKVSRGCRPLQWGWGCSGDQPCFHPSLTSRDSGGSHAGTRAKRPRKTPVGKSKRKVPEGPQPGVPEVKGGEGKVRKPRVKTGAGQG